MLAAPRKVVSSTRLRGFLPLKAAGLCLEGLVMAAVEIQRLRFLGCRIPTGRLCPVTA